MMNIVQINTLDVPGGAARVTGMLHGYFKRNGCRSKRIVGGKLGADPDTVELAAAMRDTIGKLSPVAKCLTRLSGLPRTLRRHTEAITGMEDLGTPAAMHVAEMLPEEADVVLCHNLHGGYFDLCSLPALSKHYPVVLVMHDAWLLAGHCAHSFDCEKWTDGCGECPYLDVQYALKRDTSHINWLRKKRIYDSCRLYLITPSQWLMDKVERSMLKPAVIKSRVINNGVDQKIFCPGNKNAIRADLGIAVDDHVVMFAANGIRESIWKDYATMRAAVAEAALSMPEKHLYFLAVGENAPDEKIGTATICFVPYKTPEEMTRYYRAADVYIHAARAENFPNTVIEALSCGTPVIATAVGGMPEQIKGLSYEGDISGLNYFDAEEATGILTPVGDAAALSRAMCHLFRKPEILQKLSVTAARDARMRFNLEATGNQYLEFLEEVIADWKAHAQAGNGP